MFYICRMNVNDELVDKLANLARLEFNTQEKEEIKKDLQEMIGFIDKLNELDTSGVEPLLHMSENINILREDEVSGAISREDAFNNCTIRYGDMKKQLAEDMVSFIAPIRKKVNEILSDEKYLEKIMKQGAEKAIASADVTMKIVRKAMGLNYY